MQKIVDANDPGKAADVATRASILFVIVSSYAAAWMRLYGVAERLFHPPARRSMTMKKADVQIGAAYLVKVAGNLVPVKIDAEYENSGWVGTSQKTGKSIRIKSPQRLRKRLGNVPDTTDEPAEAVKDGE